MTTALVLTGGLGHDFALTTARVMAELDSLGVSTTVTNDVDDAWQQVDDGLDVLIVNAHRCRLTGERWAHVRDRWSYATPPSAGPALWGHLARGGGLVALHAAVRGFDDWPGWGEALGASWDASGSHHRPFGPVDVLVADGEPFVVEDEAYAGLTWHADVDVLATDAASGQPLAWRRRAGGGRVAVDLLGHDARSYDAPARVALLRANFVWAAERR
jgi:uncharacterized protein